jgi:hypothetical protein
MKAKLPNIKAEKIPGWAVGVLAVAGVLAVGATAYFVYRAVKKIGEKKEDRQTSRELNKELQDVQDSGVKATSPDSVYKSTADFIEQKLDGCEISTSELDVVKEIVRVVKNQADWIKLNQAFGTRTLDNCGPFTGETKYTSIASLLKDQLDSPVYLISEDIGGKSYTGRYISYDLLKSILATRNIKF